ncbi:D-alanine--D-alanine ligase family protein [Treponema sp.]|uniref:D-alanine--D-alanine ligase family protein n=1 Tax=Treponema sp. TaxID=166 RepID=UPI0025CDC931|nr:D-alanine--D-alanine ligase family protein [Treponema sp.]MCR5218635.1 D-alanine--D-alanine ligase [Treponema sp.]
MNVILIYGGKSGEHEISLLSCASVARAISSEHKVKMISISKKGKWYLEDDSVFEELRKNPEAKLAVHEDKKKAVSILPGNDKNSIFYADGSAIPCDVVFPVMHGTYSEDGTIQGLFEMAGIPYVGCGVLASSASMDKDTTKILWKAAGLPVVPGICITRSDVNDSARYDKIIDKVVEDYGFPLFVKPCSAGSSDGASKANNRRELNASLMEAFSWDNKVLVEKAINAREVECSVTGNSITEDASCPCTVLKAYGPGEIVPKHVFYDYDAKYNDPDGAELKIPALLSEDKLEYIRTTAKKAYAAVNASGLSRVDFFIDRDSGKTYLNEINTLPGFTSISMFPKMCSAAGLEYSKLIDFLMEEAIHSFNEKSRLCTSRT